MKTLYETLAKQIPAIRENKVWCRTCGKSKEVDSEQCLQYGWPKCCGYTMTIDHPSTWDKSKTNSQKTES